MTSINTNIAAQTALRTLQSTNMQLDQTQGRISTGLKIGEAKDNAAYWSISTSLRSDNKALGTVKDALGLGAATVDVAYQGLNEALAVLDEIKSKLASSTQPGVNREAIQSELKELQSQLTSIATSASFSGENWLATNSAGNETKTIVSSFNRLVDGTVSLGTVDVSLAGVSLINAGSGTGVLDAGFNVEKSTVTFATTANTTFATGDTLTFTIAVNGSTSPTTVTITRADVNAALGVSTGTVAQTQVAELLNWKFANMGINNVSAEQSGNNVVLSAYSADKTAGADNDASIVIGAPSGTAQRAADLGIIAKANNATDNTKTTLNVNALNISVTDAALTTGGATTEAQRRNLIEAYVSSINVAIEKVTDGASKLGAVASRIELQQSFVSNLMDTIDQGISGLVDADMNEESTRLQALQVKQQLGVQALSIANQSAQNVLRLFQ